MNFHGVKEWRNHLPELNGKKIAIIPIIILLTLSSTWALYFILDNLARWFPDPSLTTLEPWFPFIGPIVALTCAYLMVYSVWYRREKLLASDKVTAYGKAFIYGLAGVSIILATTIHLFDPMIWFPLHLISLPPPYNPLTSTLASSVWDLLAGHNLTSTPLLQVILGTAVFVFGLLIALRSVETFGFDYATVIYLYYPEESQLIDHKIYSIVRNPIYLAAITIGLGGLIFRCSIYTTLVWVFLLLVFVIHIRFVEDRELVERFGDSFRDYQRRVPSLIVYPRNWDKLVLFLFGKLN